MATVPNHQQLHVWLSDRLHERLVKLAEKRGTSKAELVRVAVKAMVDGLV
jgi:predicted DNA-binding protein